MTNAAPGEAAEITAPLRKTVLQVLLTIILAAGGLFLFVNLRRHNYSAVVVEALMMVYASGVLAAVRRTANLRLWILAYLVPLFTAMLYVCWQPASSSAVFVWVLLIPVLAYLLLGRRLGFVMTAVYLSAALAVFVHRYTTEALGYEPVQIADFVICAASLFGLSHAYELIRERTQDRLRQMALHDPLTGLSNRARFEALFERERGHFLRNATPVCILLIDLDHFKRINDTFGHAAGDDALRLVARLFKARLRSADVVSRIGGEEFAVVLANTTPAHAVELAERLRRALSNHAPQGLERPIRLTATIGVAEVGRDGEDLHTLLACADRRLYQGKARGRDCVVHSLA